MSWEYIGVRVDSDTAEKLRKQAARDHRSLSQTAWLTLQAALNADIYPLAEQTNRYPFGRLVRLVPLDFPGFPED